MSGPLITEADVKQAFRKAWDAETPEQFLYLHQEYKSLKQDFELQNESSGQEQPVECNTARYCPA